MDLYYLIPAVIAYVFNPPEESAIHIGVPANKTKAEIETKPATVETKMHKCSM